MWQPVMEAKNTYPLELIGIHACTLLYMMSLIITDNHESEGGQSAYIKMQPKWEV